MSICPKNKNNKTNTNLQSTSSTNKKTKDERPYTSSAVKVPPKKTYIEGKRGSADYFISRQSNKGSWRGQQSTVGQRKSSKYERYASGSSYLKPDGNVKETAKKVSLNHLLNFKFEPRNGDDSQVYSTPRYKTPSRRQYNNSKFNKERFLQANCQFIVKENGDYTVHYVDPDVLVPWDKIEQIRVKSENEWSCPICLYPPSVAKITKCGHIYCWPCILHYLALDDKASVCRECPICHVDVKKEDLRSVVIENEYMIHVGSEITMELMVRSSHSLQATPIRKSGNDQIDSSVPEYDSKITQYSLIQVLDLVVEPELETLKCKLAEDLDDLEREFVNAAIFQSENTKSQLISDISKDCSLAEKCRDGQTDPAEKCRQTDKKFDGGCGGAPNDEVDSSTSQNPGRTYYFYQYLDGGNVYLNGLNIKCLLKEYKSFNECPPTISAKVVNMESFVMTEELRKRYKYLSHLPLSCEYKSVELDLQPPLVSQDTLDEFKDEIVRKAEIRRKKDTEENSSRRRSEIQEERKLNNFYRAHSSSSGYSSLRSVLNTSVSSGSVSVLVTEENKAAQDAFQDSISGSLSSEYSISPRDRHDSASRSFAEMLKSGEVAAAKPLIKRFHGQTPLVTSEFNNNIQNNEDCDGDTQDPFYMPPTYKSSFGDALTLALDSIEISARNTDGKSENGNVTPKQPKRKQKRKKKQTLLFSTSSHLHHL